MNTPRSKSTKRQGKFVAGATLLPEGLKGGVQDKKYLCEFSELVMTWPHLEEAMVFLMADLLGGIGKTPARQVFHSVQSTAARIKIMRSALEDARVNKDKAEWIDVAIDEFKALSKIRNELVHGLWWTGESGKVYLAKQSTKDFFIFDEHRHVRLKEIKEASRRMDSLMTTVYRGLARIAVPSPADEA